MMRVIKCVLPLLFMPLVVFCQRATNTEDKDSSDVYYLALESYLIKEDINGIFYVEAHQLTTNGLPYQIEGVELKVLEGEDILKMARRGDFLMHRIIPLRFEKGIFYVNILPFIVKCKRKKLEMINQGGLKLKFKYNCDSNALELIE